MGAEPRSPNILLQVQPAFYFQSNSAVLLIATTTDWFLVRAGRNLESPGPTSILLERPPPLPAKLYTSILSLGSILYSFIFNSIY